MKLFQKKLILLIVAVLIVLNVIILGGSRLILLDSYLRIERQAVEENLLRVANAVRKETKTLGTLCADWAVWDDTYVFVQEQNAEYVASNLGDQTLIDLKLNALLIFDAAGRSVFGKGMNLDQEQRIDVPHELLDYFQQHNRFWPPLANYSIQDGLLLFSGRPMQVSFRPILTSQWEGPARGILVMARWLDQSVIDALSEQTALPIDLQSLPEGFSASDPVVRIHPVTEGQATISGEVLVHDMEGQPAFYLHIAMPRAMYAQGRSTVAYFQLSFFLISMAVGLALYLVLVATRKKRAIAEKRFRYVFENATDGLFVVEKNQQLAFINSAALKLLAGAQDPEQAEQICFSHPELQELIRTGLDGKVAGPVEISLSNPQHQLSHLRAYMAPMLGEDGQWLGTIATLQDITREKELERLKNEFIASAAHELNTPLSIVIGYADLLLCGEYKNEQELREFLSLINEKSHALEKIVDDLLHLGKIESGRELYLEVEPFDLSATIRQLVEAFRKESGQHQFVADLLDEGVVVADRHRLGQVLDNLLSNAVKYSPDGGTISVSSFRLDNELVICVADQGVGLTEEQVGRVFEKFYRVDNSSTAVRGLGLGLNISRNIVQAHGGRIWLESSPGKGTRFYFTLPDVQSFEVRQSAGNY